MFYESSKTKGYFFLFYSENQTERLGEARRVGGTSKAGGGLKSFRLSYGRRRRKSGRSTRRRVKLDPSRGRISGCRERVSSDHQNGDEGFWGRLGVDERRRSL